MVLSAQMDLIWSFATNPVPCLQLIPIIIAITAAASADTAQQMPSFHTECAALTKKMTPLTTVIY